MGFNWESWIRGCLSGTRLNHSRQVAALAVDLAPFFGVDGERAFLAGLLHDAARLWQPTDWLKTAEAFSIVVTDVERAAPILLHGPIGAELVKREGLADPAISAAIAYHTTAAPGWDGLGRLLYVADHVADRPSLQARARLKPEEFYWRLLGWSLRRAVRDGHRVSPHTLGAWNEHPGAAVIRKERNHRVGRQD